MERVSILPIYRGWESIKIEKAFWWQRPSGDKYEQPLRCSNGQQKTTCEPTTTFGLIFCDSLTPFTTKMCPTINDPNSVDCRCLKLIFLFFYYTIYYYYLLCYAQLSENVHVPFHRFLYACFFLFRKVCHNSNDVDDFSARLLFKIAPAWNNMLHHAFCRKDSLLCWLHSKSKIFRKVQFYFSKNISNSFNWSSVMKGLMLDDERFFFNVHLMKNHLVHYIFGTVLFFHLWESHCDFVACDEKIEEKSLHEPPRCRDNLAKSELPRRP